MAGLTISALYRVPATFQSAIGATTLIWTAGTEYTLAGVVARLNATFGAYLLFAVTPATGMVVVTPYTPPYTLTWGHSTLATMLGFAGAHLVSIDQTDTASDGPCLAYWQGKAATPWGHTASTEIDDVVSPYGRLTVTGSGSQRTTGNVHLWIHRRGDSATFADDLTRLYLWADQAARHPLTLTDNWGTVTYHVLAEGWECAPKLLDDETLLLEVETVSWPA